MFIPKLEEIKKHYEGKDISDMADDVLKTYKEKARTPNTRYSQ
jgi:hypothetical protein